MRLTERLLPYRRRRRQPERADAHVQDPHGAQTIRVRLRGHGPLRGRQRRHDGGVGTGRAAPKGIGDAGAEGGLQGGAVLLHAVLEDDAADDDGDGGGEVADEAEGGGGGGDVLGRDEGLQGDEGGLEVRADADAGDDLEDDDAGPGRVGREVDEEAEAEGHEGHAGPDGGEVLARLADEDADGGGHEGEGEDEGEEVETRAEWGGAEHGLEVEREEVGAADEDEAVAEADDEGGDVGEPREEAERHDRVSGDFPLVEEEEAPDHDAEDDKAHDGGRVPGVLHAAEFETDEEHDGAADDGDRAEPVDGFEAGEDGGLGGFDVEEEEEDYKGQAVTGY